MEKLTLKASNARMFREAYSYSIPNVRNFDIANFAKV
jgi:CYTH domain-containing protein